MRINLLTIGLLTAALAGPARGADTEVDRLRDALRSATQQSRALEDQRAALQTQLSDSNRQRDNFKKEVDVARAQVKKAQDDYRRAVGEFNERLEERNQVLDKWKAAYEEAATVARSKDADRAKFEGEARSFQASTKSCEARNVQLVKVAREILRGYRDLDMMKVLGIEEPLIGTGRVEHQNNTQSYLDRILDPKAKP